MLRRWFAMAPLSVIALSFLLLNPPTSLAGWGLQAPANTETSETSAPPADPQEESFSAKAEPLRISMNGAASEEVKNSVEGSQEVEYVISLPPGLDLTIEVKCQPEKAVIPVLTDLQGKKTELRDEGPGTWMGAVPATEDGKDGDFLLTVKKSQPGPGKVAFSMMVTVPEAGEGGGETSAPVVQQKASTSETRDFRTVIAPSGLSLRVKPDPKSKKLAALPKGTKVEVLSIDGPGDMYEGISAQWFKIRANGQEGWAFGGFIGEPGEKPVPEGSGIRGAVFSGTWEKDASGDSLFQLTDPKTENLKLQNQEWKTLKIGQTSGKWEFTTEGFLMYDGVFLTRDIGAYYSSSDGAHKGDKLMLAPVSPSGRQLFFECDGDGGVLSEYLLNLDQGNIRQICVSKYGADKWIEWSPDGKSVLLKATNEGEVRKYSVDLVSGKDTLLETVPEGK